MNFLSRYKSNTSRQTVKTNLNNEILTHTTAASANPECVNTSNELIKDNQNSNDANTISNKQSIVLFKSGNYSKMPKKDKKRQSKSASSILRQLLTCGGVVASCSGSNGTKSSDNSRRSSRSGQIEIQIPDIILTHHVSEEKMSSSIKSLLDNKASFFSEPNLPINQSNDDQIVPEDKQLVLPVIKLNDDLLTSENCEECIEDDESDDENVVDENFDDYTDDEDEEEFSAKIDDENSFQNNVTSIIIEEADDEPYLNDTQVFEEEEYSLEKESKLNANLSSTTIPSFSFEIHSDDQDKSESINKSEEPEAETQKSKSCPKMASYNSKFLTANNILTDRGCLVNIRTGSFNLGCQSTASSISLSQDKCLNDEELIDSHEFFSSLQHENSEFKNSASNYSFRSYNGSLESNALNLLIPFLLIKNRRKSSNLNDDKSNENLFYKSELNEDNTLGVGLYTQPNSNLLSVSCGSDQDQIRRCSHDPNIEKLHKTYIENVKLSSAQVFSSNNNIYSSTSKPESGIENSAIKKSAKNPIKSLKFSGNFISLDNNQNFRSLPESDDKFALESEKADVLNEIYKVDKWLIDNRNNHLVQKKELSKKMIKKLPSMTISEDEDNLKSVDSLNHASKTKVNYCDDENDEHSNSVDTKAKYSSETNDSAIDIRSYGSISTLSKASSSKSRVNWQSFSKCYHYYFFQSMNTTWSKYQIAAMSLEQLMALRKLALIQFSKLVERQHSSMIRTFRLFSKKNSANEFQRVYDSIDSMDPETSSASKVKPIQNSSQINHSNPNTLLQTKLKESAILIGNRKVSNHLGAQVGHYLSNERINTMTKKKRHRNSIKISDNQHLTESVLISKDENSVSSNHLELIESLVAEDTKQIPNVKKKLVFGLPLSTIMQLSGQPLPQPILESMRYIRKIAPTEIGVFRKNGNKTRIKKLKESIDNNEAINFVLSDLTVFDVADTLKLYFRELPECLITNKLSDILLANYSKIRPEERKTTLQQVMLLIPDENRLVLQTLLLFLNDISKHHKVNQMSRNNLAVIFSPVIFSMNFDSKKKNKHLKNISTLPVNLNLVTNEAVNAESANQQTEKGPDNGLSANRPVFDIKELKEETKQEESESNLKQNSNYELGPKPNTIEMIKLDSKHISKPTVHLSSANSSSKLSNQSNLDINSNLVQMINSKRKYSNRLNKAASTIVNFRTELSTNKTTGFFFDSVKDNLETFEYMNKVVQLCVSDMIKYSMELFTVPIENFEKLKLSVSFGSEPHNLEYFYDNETKCIKRAEFFSNNIKIDKTNWFYFDKFEDVSIYYFKNDILYQSLLKNVESGLPYSGNQSVTNSVTIQLNDSVPTLAGSEAFESVQSSFAIPQQNESFNDKLKLWKCCTLIKCQNLTLENILTRIKDERKLWDDDFRDGKLVEKLDDQTELYRYVISFMPPHPSRDFFEIRHFSIQEGDNQTIILTSTSVKHQAGNKLVGDIRSNLIISKYVIEKLISTDTMTTFKITHYIKMDYKGFTMEFYNKTFGYMMARLLYNLKISLLNSD